MDGFLNGLGAVSPAEIDFGFCYGGKRGSHTKHKGDHGMAWRNLHEIRSSSMFVR